MPAAVLRLSTSGIDWGVVTDLRHLCSVVEVEAGMTGRQEGPRVFGKYGREFGLRWKCLGLINPRVVEEVIGVEHDFPIHVDSYL